MTGRAGNKDIYYVQYKMHPPPPLTDLSIVSAGGCILGSCQRQLTFSMLRVLVILAFSMAHGSLQHAEG